MYGLLSLYNSQRYMNAYFTQNMTVFTQFNNVLGTDNTFPENSMLMIQGWLFEGAFKNFTTYNLTFGWNSSAA